jgi:hypothetical protein
MVRAGLLVPCGLAAMGSVACGQAAPGSAAPPRAEFQSPRRVEILGYSGSAMEPFISCDGRYLFFNNRNDPGEQTDVLFAERAENDAFRFLGPVPGVNQPPPVLDAVPSMNAQGELFFISTRSYETTLSTVTTVILRARRTDVSLPFGPPEPVAALSGFVEAPSLSCDGSTLYYHQREGGEFFVFRVSRAR